MLVLSRKVGEKLVIGNTVTIEVLSVSGESVRIGIVAPRETSVHRHEVFVEIEAANLEAEAASAAINESAVENIAALVRERQK